MGYDERISERLGEQTVDLPVPQVIESVEMQLECVAEQITDLPVSTIFGGARAESYAGADHGIPCASVR